MKLSIFDFRFLIVLLLLAVCVPAFGQGTPVCPYMSTWIRTLFDDETQAAAQTTLGLGTGDSPTFTGLTLSGDTFIIATSKTPASPSAAGTQGQAAWDSSYIYVCVAANTWKRAALSTWAAPENMIYAGENVIYAGEQVVYLP